MKKILYPGKFVKSLTGKFSWILLAWFFILSSAHLIVGFIRSDIDTIRESFLQMAGLPLDSTMSNIAVIQSVVLVVLFDFISTAVIVLLVVLVFKYIFKAFKRHIAYFKIINIYMYGKIVSIIFATVAFLLLRLNKDYREFSETLLLNPDKQSEMLWSTSTGYVYVTIVSVSMLIYLSILIYGVLISLKKIPVRQLYEK